MTPLQTIPPRRVREKVTAGEPGLLVDVRTPAEFREVHAEGAVNLPLDGLTADNLRALRNGETDGPVYLLCRSGSRAKMACEKLSKAGLTNLFVVEGGTQAWDNAGLPVERGKAAMSLERQVRIVAGGIVLIGTLLGVFVNPWFLVIPAGIGTGLMYAGITDSCMMGMILARMPWNQVKGETCPS